MRALAGATATELAASTIRPAMLVRLDATSGTLRWWTGVGDLTWDGATWSGLGTFAEVGQIEELAGTQAGNVTLQMSGIPSGMVSLVLGENLQGRAVRIWLALLDGAGALVGTPIQVFGGRADVVRLSDSGDTAQVTLTCESRLVDLQRLRLLRYTDEEQRRLYPTDKGLEYVALIQDKEIYWGVATPGRMTGGGGGTSYVVAGFGRFAIPVPEDSRP